MTIEQATYGVLSGAGGVTALVADRIKPEGVYQNIPLPWIKHFVVTVAPLHTHQGMAALKEWPYQVSYFAPDIRMLTNIRTAVMAALDASANPKYFIRGITRLDEVESTDKPTLGEALLLDAWYE